MELVQESVLALRELEGTSAEVKQKAVETLSANVQAMKHLLYGFPEQPVDPEQAIALATAVWDTELLALLVFNLQQLEFECRKDVAQVVSSLLRKTNGSFLPTVELLASTPAIMHALLAGYGTPSIALSCGLMLREASRHESLCRQVLYSSELYCLFEHIESPLFEVASDAFSSLKELLTKHKVLVSDFLCEHYEAFFGAYSRLLTSGSYVTKRQSLKLLSELLLDRANFKVMTRYIASADDFKLVMLLLRDSSKTIQFEAFHVFKIFVANPNRPKPIVDILLRNQDKLVSFLQHFQAEKEDEQFAEEKSFLIAEILSVRPAEEQTSEQEPKPAASAPAAAEPGIPRAAGSSAGVASASGSGILGGGAGGGLGGDIPRGGIPRGGGIPRWGGGGGASGPPRADTNEGGTDSSDFGAAIPRAGR